MVDRRRLAQQLVFQPGAAAQLLVLAAQARGLHGSLDDQQQAVGLEGFLDEVIGPELDGLDRRLDIAMPADHDDGQARMFALYDLEGLQTVKRAALKPDVEDDHCRPAGTDRFQRTVAIGRFPGLVAFVLENARDEKADIRLIVDDQNVTRHEP